MDLSKQGDEEAPREKKKDARKGRKEEGDNYHEWVEIRREVEEQEEGKAERSRKGRGAKNGQEEEEKIRKLHNSD